MSINMTVTQAAERFMKRMVKFSGLPDAATAGFRLTVTAGGCSGYNSEFTVESAALAGDLTVDVSGLKVFMPAETGQMLEGVTVDFADTPTKSGLTFFNPNAAACACSSSGEGSSTPAPSMAKIEISSIKTTPRVTS